MIVLTVGKDFHDDDVSKRISSPATHPSNGSRKARTTKNGRKQSDKKKRVLAATSTSEQPKKQHKPWQAMVLRGGRVQPQEPITSLYPPDTSAPVGGTYHPELSVPVFTSKHRS
jgi:hypothetical protein